MSVNIPLRAAKAVREPPLVLARISKRTWSFDVGRAGLHPAAENRPLLVALAPEAALLQGLKARFKRALPIGGAKAPPFLETIIGTLINPTKC